MKKQKTFPVVVWFLVGILAIAAATLSLGSNDTKTVPSPTSYSPSGTKALADLLRAEGYNVSYTDSISPSLADKPVLVSFSVVKDQGSFGESQTDDSAEQTDTLVRNYLEGGGSAVVFGMAEDFAAQSKKAIADKVSIDSAGESLVVNAAPLEGEQTIASNTGSFPIATSPSGSLAEIVPVGKGKLLAVSNGIIATNRFIDQNQNATALLHWIQIVIKPRSHLLVLGSSFTGTQPGLLETLGAWAIAAWWQLILLFIVIVYSLGKPFGYPDEYRRKLLGARDMVDAVAQTYKRARATNVALSWLAEDADHEIRHRLKLSMDVPEYERNRLIPAELATSLANVQAAGELRPNASNALQVAKKLDAQMKGFFGDRKPRARRKITK